LFIYLISGLDDPRTAAQALQAGAHAYLTKPFSLGRFFETLPDCLRRRKLGVHETHTSRDFSSSGTTETPEPAAVVANSLLPTSDRLQSSAVQRQSRSAGQEQGLLAKPTVRKELLRIVTALENNFHTRQDLLQEAFVYFWSKAQQCPGRELSWYLQGARFHLKNLRRTGRSLDSSKRRAARSQPADNCDRPNESLDAFDLSDDIMSEINARDIHAVLIDRLEPIDQTILVALEEGWASREVAKRLQLSHESVRRHRLKVAAAALKLGIVPLISSQALPL